MDQQAITQDKKSFSRSDSRLVCGMLVFYGVCILGLIGATIWGLDRRSKKISADATSTAFAIGTQQANVTATAVAHATEQAEYEVVDRFESKDYHWRQNSSNDEYAIEQKKIADGVYTWNVDKVKKPFISWAYVYLEDYSSSYDAYVDTRIVKGTRGMVGSGLVFGISSSGFDGGAFVFVVSNDATYTIEHYSEEDGWHDIVNMRYHPYIHVGDWNRLEVSSGGEDFVLSINGEVVYKSIDNQYPMGKDLALIMNVSEDPARIQFDNFGYQPR